MKTIAMIAAAVAISTGAQAQEYGWPCYVHPATGVCEPAAFQVLKFRDIKAEQPTSQSRTVIRGPYGTSIISSTYRTSRR